MGGGGCAGGPGSQLTRRRQFSKLKLVGGAQKGTELRMLLYNYPGGGSRPRAPGTISQPPATEGKPQPQAAFLQ